MFRFVNSRLDAKFYLGVSVFGVLSHVSYGKFDPFVMMFDGEARPDFDMAHP